LLENTNYASDRLLGNDIPNMIRYGWIQLPSIAANTINVRWYYGVQGTYYYTLQEYDDGGLWAFQELVIIESWKFLWTKQTLFDFVGRAP